MAKVEFEIEFDTERDADFIALFEALPEPHKSRFFALAVRFQMDTEALDRIRDVLGWPVEPGTKATATQLDAIRAALDAAGLWIDDQEGDK